MSFARAARSSLFDSLRGTPSPIRARSTTPRPSPPELPTERTPPPRSGRPSRSPSIASSSRGSSPVRRSAAQVRAAPSAAGPVAPPRPVSPVRRATPPLYRDAARPASPLGGRLAREVSQPPATQSTRGVVDCDAAFALNRAVTAAFMLSGHLVTFCGAHAFVLATNGKVVSQCPVAVATDAAQVAVTCGEAMLGRGFVGTAGGDVIEVRPLRHGVGMITEFGLLSDASRGAPLFALTRLSHSALVVAARDGRITAISLAGEVLFQVELRGLMALCRGPASLLAVAGSHMLQLSLDDGSPVGAPPQHLSEAAEGITAVAAAGDSVWIGTAQGRLCRRELAGGDRRAVVDVGIHPVTRILEAGAHLLVQCAHGPISVLDRGTLARVQQLAGTQGSELIPLSETTTWRFLAADSAGHCRRLAKTDVRAFGPRVSAQCSAPPSERARDSERSGAATSDGAGPGAETQQLRELCAAQRSELDSQASLITALREANTELEQLAARTAALTDGGGERGRTETALCEKDHLMSLLSRARDSATASLRKASLHGVPLAFTEGLEQCVRALDEAARVRGAPESALQAGKPATLPSVPAPALEEPGRASPNQRQRPVISTISLRR